MATSSTVLADNPITPGYAWSCTLAFAPGFLLDGETIRVDFRRRAWDAPIDAGETYRLGDVVGIDLTPEQTADMAVGSVMGDLVLETDDGDRPTAARIVVPVLDTTTKASA